ncbi:hypothetical protein AVEN_218461-1, partial [Araneus ventricosus]
MKHNDNGAMLRKVYNDNGYNAWGIRYAAVAKQWKQCNNQETLYSPSMFERKLEEVGRAVPGIGSTDGLLNSLLMTALGASLCLIDYPSSADKFRGSSKALTLQDRPLRSTLFAISRLCHCVVSEHGCLWSHDGPFGRITWNHL